MRFLVFSCIWAAAGAMSAQAFSVSPTRIILGHDRGGDMTVRLAVQAAAIPIEVTVIERLPDGVFAPVSDAVMTIFPPQFLLETDEPRTLQISISGGIAMEKGRSFYLRIEELGLRSSSRLARSEQEVKLLTTYLLPIHVTGGHEGSLTATISADAAGQAVILENAGRGPVLLSGCRVVLTWQAGPEIEIDGHWIAQRIGSDAILPDQAIGIDLVLLFAEDSALPASSAIDVHALCHPT